DHAADQPVGERVPDCRQPDELLPLGGRQHQRSLRASDGRRREGPVVNAVSARRTRILSLACVAALASLSTAAAQTDSARAFTVDDVLRLETLGRVAASPDGKRVAIVVERARTERERYPMPFLQGDARGDIWIARTDSGPALRLTNGGVDGAGYWDPVWSPDGRRLAMLSNAGDGVVHAYVWTVP